MNELVACFEKRFRGGASIQAQLQHPIDSFSVLVLFGPSGSGKTTILRSLAGLETPNEGNISFAGRPWFDAERGVNLRPQQRGIGYLFQNYALFPHLSVRRNIAFGMTEKSADAAARVDELLARFDLAGLADRLPGQISGGQQQRVALARALACRPRLLLLDEPLSSLDQQLREQVRSQLRSWLSAASLPTILVTHDRTDAMAIGDRVAVLSDGRVLQHGPLAEVFSSPIDEVVARIVGIETILPGRIVERSGELVCVEVRGVRLWATGRQLPTNSAVVCIRGEDVILSRHADEPTSVRNRLPGKIRSLTPEGPLVRVAIDCGFSLTALVTNPARQELELRPGDSILALIKATAIHVTPH